MDINTAIQTFTHHAFAEIVNKGGDYEWVLNQKRAETYRYLVCCSSVGVNRGSGFLVGKINGIEFFRVDEKGNNRYQICVSEVAAIDIPNLWSGQQNPVKYTSLEELGIDLSRLNFEDVAEIKSTFNSHQISETECIPLTIQQAKAGLAKKYGVSEDNIEILIKG